jgi:hypothetical protein
VLFDSYPKIDIIDIGLIIVLESVIVYNLIKQYKDIINNYGRLRIKILDDSILLNFPSMEKKYHFEGINKIVIGQRGDRPLFVGIYPKEGTVESLRGIDNIGAFVLDLKNKIPSTLLQVQRNHIF